MKKDLNPQEIIGWLKKCSKHGCTCEGCPYLDEPEYEDGCGLLLADAARLLEQAYPEA